jgi:hypothetical protein
MDTRLAGRFMPAVITIAGQRWLGLKSDYRDPLPGEPQQSLLN